MKIKYNKKGSITILIIYIFIVAMVFSSLVLTFALLQASLSKNQLEKIQYKYSIEDDLNKIVYDKDIVDKYISGQIYKTFRNKSQAYGIEYEIKLDKDDKLRDTIESASFSLENIDGKLNIILNIKNKYNNTSGSIVAYGPCIHRILDSKRVLWCEDQLGPKDKDLFIEFIDKIQLENCDYDCRLDSKSIKINTEENIAIEFDSKMNYQDRIFDIKKISKIYNESTNTLASFTLESLIVNLKPIEGTSKSLTIGELGKEDLIKLNGVLYIEGDLIINQDFEFLGLIIVNNGSIIVNTPNKPKVKGMLFTRSEDAYTDELELIYDRAAIYKAGTFLPGFIDIKIDTIKKY